MRSLTLLLPALIPSWRFFKTVAPSPRVETWMAGEWRALPPPDMPLSLRAILLRIVWNPRWNAHLFTVTLAEKLAETGDARAETLLRRHIAACTGQNAESLRFRLIFVHREDGRILREELYRSAA